MNRLFVLGLLGVGIYYTVTGASGIFKDIQSGNAALVLQGITSEELNERILEHYRTTVLGVANFTADAIDTTITDLNDDGKKDVIAIAESGMTCGGGGCIASIFIENDLGELAPIPFQYAVKKIEVLESLTQGMHDLKINNETNRRMVWNGTTYVPEEF